MAKKWHFSHFYLKVVTCLYPPSFCRTHVLPLRTTLFRGWGLWMWHRFRLEVLTIFTSLKNIWKDGAAITKKEYRINKPPPSFHFRHNSVFKRLLMCLKEKICCPRLRISLPYFCWWSHPIKKSGRPRPGSLKIDCFIKTPCWEYGKFIFPLLGEIFNLSFWLRPLATGTKVLQCKGKSRKSHNEYVSKIHRDLQMSWVNFLASFSFAVCNFLFQRFQLSRWCYM